MADNPITGAVVMDPVPRIEGHLGIELSFTGSYTTGTSGTCNNVNAKGEMYRGFENILKGHHPTDALHITQRI
ncbi:MAG: hypothetical protein M1548_08380 [Actinobacteria bacterium]|nr:hypothetical protein [Actinomycetota bacterium]